MAEDEDDDKNKILNPPMDVDISKYDNVPLEDMHLNVRPRIKNIIEELYAEHDWQWPPAPATDVRKMRFFKRKKNKLLYNKEALDFATFLSIILGPLEVYIAIIFTVMPKTFILAMRECVEITALIIVLFFVQGLYHIYAGVLGLALRASRPFEIGYIYPHWTFQVACPLLGLFCVFAGMYMTQEWMVEKEMMVHLKGYNFHWYSKNMWDSYQKFMRCCGVESYKDWKNHGPLMYDVKRERTLGVPESCCSTSNCSLSPNEDNVYDGCFDKTIYTFWTLYILGAICVCLSFILLCMGHRSLQESSRYNGDPIHKLLFDDRWSKKRLHNRSNRREELFSLLNHYCLILGKELGFNEEVDAAEKEDGERQEMDKETEAEKDRYAYVDTYTGNSPPTPGSNMNIPDVLNLPAKGPEEGPNSKPKDKEGNTDNETKLSSSSKKDVNPPPKSENNFTVQQLTILPSILAMETNLKINEIFKTVDEEAKLEKSLGSLDKSVTEIPKINDFLVSISPFQNSATPRRTFNDIPPIFSGQNLIKLESHSVEMASCATSGSESPSLPSNIFRETDTATVEEDIQQVKLLEDSEVTEEVNLNDDGFDSEAISDKTALQNQVVSIVSLGHYSPSELSSIPSFVNPTYEPTSRIASHSTAEANKDEISVADASPSSKLNANEPTSSLSFRNNGRTPSDSSKQINANEAELIVSTVEEPSFGGGITEVVIDETTDLITDNMDHVFSSISKHGIDELKNPVADVVGSVEPSNVGPILETPIMQPSHQESILESSNQESILEASNQVSVLESSNQESILESSNLTPKDKKESNNEGTAEKTERAHLHHGHKRDILRYSKTPPAYFKSALEQAQKASNSEKDPTTDNISAVEKILGTTIRTKVAFHTVKSTASDAFKELVATLNKSASLTKLQQECPANQEKLKVESKKSHEFDGFTPTSKKVAQKLKKSGIPTASNPATKSPKQHVPPLLTRANFPRRLGETVTSDSDDDRATLRSSKDSKLPKRAKQVKR